MADENPTEITVADLFRVMNEIRKEQSAFRESVDERFDSIETRLERVENKLEGQTEKALQLLMIVISELREQMHSLQAWAKSRGAEL